MRRVLIIAPDFSPSSYPPALRIRFFTNHLLELGWEPIVLTVDPQYYEWSVDNENNQLLTDSIKVIRTKALKTGLTRTVGLGDIGLRSLMFHWRRARELCEKEKINLVFISVPPYFTAILGRMIYDEFRIPYVIDYIDPLVVPDYWKSAGRRPLKRTLAHLSSLILEPFILKHTSHVVGVSQGTIDLVLSRYQWLRKENALEIPYGAEPADFDYLRRNPRLNPFFDQKDGLFHMAYVGIVNSDMKLPVEAIFRAIQLGLQHSAKIFSRLRLHFIGTTYAAHSNGRHQVLSLARKVGLQNFIDEYPDRVSYLDALHILIDSHALLVIGSDQPHYTASKIFPYILAKKPMLAVFREESSVVRILTETNAGRLVTFGEKGLSQDKVQEVSRHLEEILSLPPGYTPPTSWEAFENYTTKAMTRRLAKVFDNVISKYLI